MTVQQTPLRAPGVVRWPVKEALRRKLLGALDASFLFKPTASSDGGGGSAIPDSVVSRPADNSQSGSSTADYGVVISSSEEWPEIGAEISSNTPSSVQNAKLRRISDGVILEEKDISSLAPGDTFRFTNLSENIQPNTDYHVSIQDPDSAQIGEYDSPSFPYTSSDGVLEITSSGYWDGASVVYQDAVDAISRVGDIGSA
ncbi:hypothetical protein [Halorubrum saccharovorum]|uniref:hypothetical protein n=1 Tax=Halorubrum saccharovorum TaxID=2248 RepID=UPI0012694D98|nr:hypothetical protein [Halorubrum saccharovorum]